MRYINGGSATTSGSHNSERLSDAARAMDSDMEIYSGGELGDNEMSCTPSSRGSWLLNASIEVDVTGVV